MYPGHKIYNKGHMAVKEKHTLCMVFCCKMNCRDGRSEAAVKFGVVGLIEPPLTGLKMLLIGPWMRENQGDGYKAIA